MMNALSKFIITYIIVDICFYLMFAFIAYEIDAGMWTREIRGGLIAVIVTFSFIFWLYYILVEKD